jgi:uncharacterized Zn finger protein (UPF0148 family)
MLEFLNANKEAFSVIASVASGLFSLFCYWQKSKIEQQKSKMEQEFEQQKTTIEQEVEKYKKQLQVEYLKVELRIKQLSSVYPELFLRFKRAGAIICPLCSNKLNNELIKPEAYTQAKLLINDAVSFMVKNLLFVSKKVEKKSDDLMMLMSKLEDVISKGSVAKIQEYKQNVRQVTDNLQSQMKEELGGDL